MPSNNLLKKVDIQEKELIKEADKIEKAQEKIEKEEREILSSEKRIFSFLKHHSFLSFFIESGVAKREIKFFRLIVSNKIAKNKLIFGLILTLAIVLIWKGFWDAIDLVPFLSDWFVSITAGVLILWFLRRYTNFPQL